MNDLISRKAAIEWFFRPYSNEESYSNFDVERALNAIPAAYAAPVVRCRNCKWWNGSTLGAAHRCAALHIATTGEFYCAAAERKCNAYADQSGAEYADNPTV